MTCVARRLVAHRPLGVSVVATVVERGLQERGCGTLATDTRIGGGARSSVNARSVRTAMSTVVTTTMAALEIDEHGGSARPGADDGGALA
jgi:hypothetical protein